MRQKKSNLINHLHKNGREIIDVSFEQMNSFACNMLEVKSRNGNALLILSQQALKSFDPSQTGLLEKFCKLVPISIPTIESIGGGSVRCMMAEIFLEPKE